jgi:hypothetical protein
MVESTRLIDKVVMEALLVMLGVLQLQEAVEVAGAQPVALAFQVIPIEQ